jgi:hypothetical protein
MGLRGQDSIYTQSFHNARTTTSGTIYDQSSNSSTHQSPFSPVRPLQPRPGHMPNRSELTQDSTGAQKTVSQRQDSGYESLVGTPPGTHTPTTSKCTTFLNSPQQMSGRDIVWCKQPFCLCDSGQDLCGPNLGPENVRLLEKHNRIDELLQQNVSPENPKEWHAIAKMSEVNPQSSITICVDTLDELLRGRFAHYFRFQVGSKFTFAQLIQWPGTAWSEGISLEARWFEKVMKEFVERQKRNSRMWHSDWAFVGRRPHYDDNEGTLCLSCYRSKGVFRRESRGGYEHIC